MLEKGLYIDCRATHPCHRNWERLIWWNKALGTAWVSLQALERNLKSENLLSIWVTSWAQNRHPKASKRLQRQQLRSQATTMEACASSRTVSPKRPWAGWTRIPTRDETTCLMRETNLWDKPRSERFFDVEFVVWGEVVLWLECGHKLTSVPGTFWGWLLT